MKVRIASIVFLLLPIGIVHAQEIEIQVEMMNRVGTDTSRKGDMISARVLSPEALKGDIVEGKVSESKAGAKMGGKATLSLSFDTLKHGSESIGISSQVRSITNSKGQVNADEEGRVIRGTNNVPKAIGGTGAGALIGGLAGGGRGAAIGAGVGAVASIVLIQIVAEGPSVRLDPGSRVTLMAKSRSGPALASLTPNAAPAPVAASPAAAPASTAPVAAPAAQPAAASQAGAAQPDLAAVKADFIPGEKTIFLDDLTDMAGDEPPPHWKVRGGTAELRTGGGVRQLTVTARQVYLYPNLTNIPKNFTMEAEMKMDGHDVGSVWKFFTKDRREAIFMRLVSVYSLLSVHFKVGNEEITNQQIKMDWSQPYKLGLWCQDGRLRLYLNGGRVFDVNQIDLPEITSVEVLMMAGPGGDNKSERHVGFRYVRFAESTPDFSQMITSSGRYVTHGILFDTDSDRIKPESAPVIRMVARGLEKNPNLKLQVEGHTDSVGNADHNLELSQRRAAAVKAALVSQFNVDAGRLTTAGLGATKPIDSNDTPTGRAQNRRVEFVRQ